MIPERGLNDGYVVQSGHVQGGKMGTRVGQGKYLDGVALLHMDLDADGLAVLGKLTVLPLTSG